MWDPPRSRAAPRADSSSVPAYALVVSCSPVARVSCDSNCETRGTALVLGRREACDSDKLVCVKDTIRLGYVWSGVRTAHTRGAQGWMSVTAAGDPRAAPHLTPSPLSGQLASARREICVFNQPALSAYVFGQTGLGVGGPYAKKPGRPYCGDAGKRKRPIWEGPSCREGPRTPRCIRRSPGRVQGIAGGVRTRCKLAAAGRVMTRYEVFLYREFTR